MSPLRKSSFTMIEMIVVISIIAILVALTAPSVIGARERARSVQCKSNLKQLHTACTSYMYEAGRLPGAYGAEYPYPSGNIQNPYRWGEVRGWVNWLNWQQHDSKTRADSERRPGVPPLWWGAGALTSITNGAIWQYTGPSLDVYVCPTFRHLSAVDVKLQSKDAKLYRSYTMNRRSHAIERENYRNASTLLLFADMHTTVSEKVRLESESSLRTVCQRGLLDNTSRTIDHYDDFGYDGALDGADKGAGIPYEALGSFHGTEETPYANAIFGDGHIEQLVWTNTIAACAGDW